MQIALIYLPRKACLWKVQRRVLNSQFQQPGALENQFTFENRIWIHDEITSVGIASLTKESKIPMRI